MTKHLRTALRLAGLRMSEIAITRSPNEHPHITIGSTGKTVVCSSTPRSPETASKLIARDLRRALG
jgi:phenylacetate-coenzyme A ligase PaaK-like adenylate-forming protein